MNVIFPQCKQRGKSILCRIIQSFFFVYFLSLSSGKRWQYTSNDIFVKQVEVEGKRIINRFYVVLNNKGMLCLEEKSISLVKMHLG